jgi:UDP-N-acetyl-D-mannosaminuronic acid dehydrogenase
LIRTAREVNDGKPQWVVDKVKAAIGEFLVKHSEKCAKDVRVAVFGLAFKPDIDDLRESPSLAIAEQLRAELAGPLLLVEPNIKTAPASLADCPLLHASDAIQAADVCVVLVAHKEFRKMDLSSIAAEFFVDLVDSVKA